jgi:type IV secretion system protein VirB9
MNRALFPTALITSLALAALAAPAGAADPRVRTVSYVASDVVQLTGHYGYQMLVALDPAERIENISIGDSVAWLVTPNKAANGLFLKPVEANAATNMTVQTDRRTYLFELKAARAARGGSTPGMIYKVEFRYPNVARPSAAVAPVAYNRAYKLSGASRIRPTQIFDDGRSTYFHWPGGTAVPAIFLAVGRREELVNHQTRGAYVVVDRVARAFVLREGKDKVRVKNKGYGKPLTATGGKAT